MQQIFFYTKLGFGKFQELDHMETLAKMKPTNYEDWKRCITVRGGTSLTLDYIEKRISELNDRNNQETKKFIKTWGEPHLQQIIKWFEQAKEEIKS